MIAARRMLAASACIATAACAGSRGAKSVDSTSVTTDSSSLARSDSSRAGSAAPVSAAPSTPSAGKSPSDAALSATPRSTPPSVSPSETVLTGRIVAGGLAATPVTQLQIEGGKPTMLIGPLEAELRRLGGAMVWVTGAPVSGPPNATFTVSRYEIVSIDGSKPVVGELVSRAGTLWLATERDTVRLLAAPANLSSKTGAKIWVVGRRSGSELTTQSYGVIREP